MGTLAVYRAVQGLGAGGLFSLALAIVGDIVPPRERAKYTGYFMAMFGTSSVLGPLIGGFFAGQDTLFGVSGWRWVFLVNVPIGIAALFVVFRTLHVHHDRREVRVDWYGAAALVVALVPLLTVAEQGRTWGWDSPRSIACFVVGGLGVVAFFLAERTAQIRQHEQFVRTPTLPELAAPHFPSSDAAGERGVDDARRFAEEVRIEPDLVGVAAEQTLRNLAEQSCPGAVDELQLVSRVVVVGAQPRAAVEADDLQPSLTQHFDSRAAVRAEADDHHVYGIRLLGTHTYSSFG